MILYTVGHSNRTFLDYIAILKIHGIEAIADVRGGKAGSRAFPHFNKESLQENLPQKNIKYRHFPELGGRRGKCQEANPTLNEEWRLPAFKNYADYAYYSDDFRNGIDELIQYGHEQKTAFMCSEAVPWRCHRSIITDWLVMTKGIVVVHITGMKQTLIGKPHSHAQLYDNSVIYPKSNVMEFFDV